MLIISLEERILVIVSISQVLGTTHILLHLWIFPFLPSEVPVPITLSVV